MGRMLKNTVFKSGSYTLGVPNTTSSIRPAVAALGQTYYDVGDDKLRYWDGANWQAVAHEGFAQLAVDRFVANGSQNTFTMSYDYASGDEDQVLAFVATVYQDPTTAYTFDGTTTVTLTSTPTVGAVVVVIHNLGSTIAA